MGVVLFLRFVWLSAIRFGGEWGNPNSLNWESKVMLLLSAVC